LGYCSLPERHPDEKGKVEMAQFFELGPEVAGSEGEGTVVANMPQLQSGVDFIPEVTHLDYEFEGWLGDDIIAGSPCYLVSDVLAAAMEQSDLSGYRLQAITVSTTEEFDRWQSKMVERPIPPFIRILLDGRLEIKGDREVVSWSGHDICLGVRLYWVPPETPEQTLANPPPYALVVTERAFEVFKKFQMAYCDVYVLEG
jgi:hypothetical protein